MLGSSTRRAALVGVALLSAVAMVAPTAAADDGYLTPQPAFLTLDAGAPAGSALLPIINSGDTLDGFTFEGIPDGIGFVPGEGTVDVYVNHEQSRVPFLGEADLEDASVSKLTLDASTAGVVDASVALPPSAGFIRFCSAFMAGPEQGFPTYTFLTNEETNDVVDVPPGATYGPDPAVAPQRQAGYVVALDTRTGDFGPIPGAGRLNHENTVIVPGGWSPIVGLTGDDTFSAPSSQLYMYTAGDADGFVADRGRLWAFQVTATQDGKVDRWDAFNGANDYGDIATGDVWQGRFIPVPKKIAAGETSQPPQDALEGWSNEHNVFQFIRIEDITYDRNEPNVVYFADTGEPRAIPSEETGRLARGPSGTQGPYPNGRIFQMTLDPANPHKVDAFQILLDADAGGYDNPGVMHQPDNVDASPSSLMVQEDTHQPPISRVWRYDFATQAWSVVAHVNDPEWESSGIVDASEVFGPGTWLLDVQAHGTFVDQETVGDVLFKREAGQLLLLTLPGS